jgi:imidazolonepropionase
MIVLEHISELATCPPGNPQDDAGLIQDAALVAANSEILWAGHMADLPAPYREHQPSVQRLDCRGSLVVPGLIDCHTHLCFGGWRGDEFEQRLAGASYREIAAGGGGILRTVQATRAADAAELLEKARTALDGMLRLGVTTVECKSGYGLDEANELKQLRVYRELEATHAVDLVSTFLGAHVIPPEFRNDRDGYVDLLCERMIPRVAEEGLVEFCDAFVEGGAFTAAEARRIFSAARDHGLAIKLHADQLSDGGGASLAAGFGAVSAEHLEYADERGIADLAQAGTVAVSLPLASLYLGERYLPARRFLDAGVPVAVATDFNPGSAPSYHLPLALTLACLNQSMTPQEALSGATTVAARALDRHDRIGSLLPGYRADFAIIDSPALNHWLYHFVPNACVAVYKGGTAC